MPLYQEDLTAAAARLGCTVSIIRAIARKESDGAGFTKAGQLKKRFEPHIFQRRTGKTASTYTAAYAINPTQAKLSTSWGMFQIMGFNFAAAGYSSVDQMIEAYNQNEQNQLDSFVKLILAWGLNDELKGKKYDAFATRYNGPNYRVNNYAVDLKKFDEQFALNPFAGIEKKKRPI